MAEARRTPTPRRQLAAVALCAGAIGAAVTLASSWWLGAFRPAQTPVAVVNLGGLVRAAAGGGEVEEADVDAGFEKMREIGEALAGEGYLVLDASAVINAPEAFYVPRRPRTSSGRHEADGEEGVQ